LCVLLLLSKFKAFP